MVSDKGIKQLNMKYSPTKWYGLPMGPRDTCFEMQIVIYAHCPSQARQPIDRLKHILLIIEYLMAIIKTLTEVLTHHFQFSSSYSGDWPLTRRYSPCCAQTRSVRLIAIKHGIELMAEKGIFVDPNVLNCRESSALTKSFKWKQQGVVLMSGYSWELPLL